MTDARHATPEEALADVECFEERARALAEEGNYADAEVLWESARLRREAVLREVERRTSDAA